MKNIIYILTLIITYCNVILAQCPLYQVYESFGSASAPTQGGSWTYNSIISNTGSVRTGSRSMGFNATGDWVRTPIISTPGIFSFYYRRSSNSTAWSCVIETSTDGTNWTSRSTISTITTTYQYYSIDFGALGLTNVYVRVRDTRASGAQERYIDDMSWTSTSVSENITLPSLSSCFISIPSGTTYTYTDQGGPSDTYNISVVQTTTFSPVLSSEKVEIKFSSLVGETITGIGYDYIEIFDGPNTTSPLIGTYYAPPATPIKSTAAGGELTIRFTSDGANNYSGWISTVYTVLNVLPITIGRFEVIEIRRSNLLQWTTYSEELSDYFSIEHSIDGIYWSVINNIDAAGKSIQKIDYQTRHQLTCLCYNYYRLKQVDIDGRYEYFGPIYIDNSKISKKIIKVIDLTGREVSIDSKGVVIEIYEDGTSKISIR